MILLNYEKKKIVHVQCGLQVSTFWPSSEDTICSWYMYFSEKNSRLRVDSGFHIDQTKQIHHISF